MKCKCCEKEIDEKNSIQGICLECNKEIIKKIKINEIAEKYEKNKKMEKTFDSFLIKILILIGVFYLISNTFLNQLYN